jgi:hypothetical protein
LNNAGLSSTVWSELTGTSQSLDLSDLEETFTLDESNRASVVSATSPKKEASTLLDINRANHIGEYIPDQTLWTRFKYVFSDNVIPHQAAISRYKEGFT